MVHKLIEPWTEYFRSQWDQQRDQSAFYLRVRNSEESASWNWRRRPDLNRGWRFCRPLPYHLATAPVGTTNCAGRLRPRLDPAATARGEIREAHHAEPGQPSRWLASQSSRTSWPAGAKVGAGN